MKLENLSLEAYYVKWNKLFCDLLIKIFNNFFFDKFIFIKH